MIQYRKRFKNIHGYESKSTLDDIIISNYKVHFNKSIYINIRIFQKNLYFEIPEGSSYNINPLSNAEHFWLYVFIDETAHLRIGTTPIDSTHNLYGRSFPNNPKPEQLFFNKDISRMFKWNGRSWVEFDAVIIGKFDKNKRCVNFYKNLSQAGFPKKPFLAEKLSEKNPVTFVRVFENGSYSFLTENESNKLGFNNLQNITLETLLHRTVAAKEMKALTVVRRNMDNSVYPATTDSEIPAVALLLHDANIFEECIILEKGFFYSRNFNWQEDFNTPLFYGDGGILSSRLINFNNVVAAQKVGYVVDLHTIYFNPEEKFIFNYGQFNENIDIPLPTPTPIPEYCVEIKCPMEYDVMGFSFGTFSYGMIFEPEFVFEDRETSGMVFINMDDGSIVAEKRFRDNDELVSLSGRQASNNDIFYAVSTSTNSEIENPTPLTIFKMDYELNDITVIYQSQDFIDSTLDLDQNGNVYTVKPFAPFSNRVIKLDASNNFQEMLETAIPETLAGARHFLVTYDGSRIHTAEGGGMMRCYSGITGSIIWENREIIFSNLLNVVDESENSVYASYSSSGGDRDNYQKINDLGETVWSAMLRMHPPTEINTITNNLWLFDNLTTAIDIHDATGAVIDTISIDNPVGFVLGTDIFVERISIKDNNLYFIAIDDTWTRIIIFKTTLTGEVLWVRELSGVDQAVLDIFPEEIYEDIYHENYLQSDRVFFGKIKV